MKKYSKWLFVVIAVISFSQVFAQHRRYDRRDYDHYRYYYRPYNYSPVRASVSIIARLPFGAVSLNLGSRHYHYYDGIYYQPYQTGYMIVQPPVGIVVPVLPPNAVYVTSGNRPYYRYQNVYYMPYGNSYQVIAEPKEEVATTQATTGSAKVNDDGYEKFVLEGKTYYKKGSKYYKATVNDNGEIQYEEVGENSK